MQVHVKVQSPNRICTGRTVNCNLCVVCVCVSVSGCVVRCGCMQASRKMYKRSVCTCTVIERETVCNYVTLHGRLRP